MLRISHRITAQTLQNYHRSEFTNPQRAYYTEGNELQGYWHGRLASEIGLKGPVMDQHFDRLTEGKDPFTGEQLLRYPAPKAIEPPWVKDNAQWRSHLEEIVGDAIMKHDSKKLAKLLHHRDCSSALKPLALPEKAAVPVAPLSERTSQLLEMHRIAAETYAQNLASREGEAVRKYLDGRNVSAESIATFALGASGSSRAQLVDKLSRFGPELMEASGLFHKTKGGRFIDRFHDRVMFPIHDEHGRVIAFAGRSVGEQDGPKYLNSPETELYKKSDVLYNLHRAKEHLTEVGRMVAVEGYMDVIAAHSTGTRNVVAISGIAMTDRQADIIGEHVKGVILNLDPDEAGRKATAKHIQILNEHGISAHVARMQGDPDEFIRQSGAEAYRKAIERPETAVRWLACGIAESRNLDDVYDRIDAMHSLIDALASADPKQREAITTNLHKVLKLEEPERETPKKEITRRAGYDFTFSPGKSISVTAMVGGDDRIFRWHRAAVREAADFGERYVQARMGGNKEPLTTGKWIAAGFEHDSARPVNGYAAPHLHTHLIVFNLTAPDANGRARAIDPKELFNLQTAMTRVYQNRLAMELRRGGYELERGKNHAPEIKGYTREYLDSESLRTDLIQRELERLGMTSRKAVDIISQQSREDKLGLKPEEVQRLHRAHGELYGQPADGVVRQARERSRTISFHEESATRPVDFAIRKLTERHSVIERDGYKQHGGIIQNALTYSQGRVTLKAIEQEIEQRKTLTDRDRANGYTEPELSRVSHYRTNAPGERYTTREMKNIERELIDLVHSRMGTYEPIAPTITKDDFRSAYSGKLLPHQMHMVWDSLNSRDQVIGINGSAGAGKTFATKVFAKIAKDHGYTVRGLAPTSTARKELEKNGIPSLTVAKHNLTIKRGMTVGRKKERTLYLLDESSLAGAAQVHKFLMNLQPKDRVVFIGDKRQHNSIDAGRIFHQLQISGMQTIHLNRIMRQRENPDLLEAVRHFQHGDVQNGIHKLDSMGSVQEVARKDRRYEAIAKQFVESPADTLVVSPDNRSREEINVAIRKGLRATGLIRPNDFTVSTLVSRNDLYQEDTRIVSSYEVGNWIRVGKSEPLLDIKSGDYLQVQRFDAERNRLIVATTDGRSFDYDPDELNIQPSVFRVETRQYSAGDRIQLTSQWKQQGLANRERGTIESLDVRGNAELRMDAPEGETGRLIRFNLRDFSHLDYAYSSTSFSAQSLTIRNVLIHIDTGDSRISALLDRILAYVASSRASHDLRIFTDDKSQLVRALDRLEIRPTALSLEETLSYRQPA